MHASAEDDDNCSKPYSSAVAHDHHQQQPQPQQQQMTIAAQLHCQQVADPHIIGSTWHI
jgi:hypothetical protein